MTTLIVDCDAAPFIPAGWSVSKHRKGGRLTFDADGIVLYLDPVQEKGRIVGNDLEKRLANQPVLNANVLDGLLAKPELIPKDWKSGEDGRVRYVFFWGTVYYSARGNKVVRYLRWDSGMWYWGHRWLNEPFDACCQVALFSS